MRSLITALLLTVVIEGITMLILARSFGWLLYNVLVNLLTNPVLNISLMWMLALGAEKWLVYCALAAGEGIVIFGEAGLYRAFTQDKFRICLQRSAITNVVSFLLGAVILSFI